MVDAFIHAGVPIGVFNNEKIRSWLTSNVKGGSTLPSEWSLRKMLKDLGAEEEAESVEVFR